MMQVISVRRPVRGLRKVVFAIAFFIFPAARYPQSISSRGATTAWPRPYDADPPPIGSFDAQALVAR